LTRFFWLGISVLPNAKFGFFIHLRTNLWFSGTMVCTNGCFARPYLVFHAPASSCSCASHCLTRGSKECGASAVTCSRVRVCCFSQLAAIFSLILLQPFPRMQVSSVLPFCPIAPPSVHQNLLPRLCPSVLRNLRPRLCPCCPTCYQTTTLQRLHITSTESGAPFLGAFALSCKSQVLNHAHRWSWTWWTALFSCVC